MSELPPDPHPAPPGGHGDDEPDWDALGRALANEPATPDDPDGVALQRWLDAHPAEATRLARLDALIVGGGAGEGAALGTPVDVEAALARVTARRLADERPKAQPTERANGPRPSPRAPAWAARGAPAPWRRRAVVALAAGVALAAVGLWRGGAFDGGAGGRGDPAVAAETGAPAAATRYAAAVGERRTVRLPDGTEVLLAPASAVELPADYATAPERRVRLDGDALFRVRHDAARPFTVLAGPAAVHDIGTAFVVRQASDGRVTVAVTEGVVRLDTDGATQPPRSAGPAAGRADSGLVLRVGERGAVARRPGAAPGVRVARLAPAAGDVADDTAWTTGRLVFRDAPLTEVASVLRRWYGVDVRAADEAIAGRHLTATFRNDSLDEVLRVLSLALGARSERQGRTVILRSAR